MGEFKTTWGSSFSVPFPIRLHVAAGPNWDVFQRTDPTLLALAWTGTKTVSKVGANEEENSLKAWAAGQAFDPSKQPPPTPPPTGPAKIQFTSTPSTAEVIIDSKNTGRLTTVTLELSPGPHQIGYLKTGYHSVQFEATAEAGKTKTVTRTLTRITEEPPPTPPAPPPEEKVPGIKYTGPLGEPTVWDLWIGAEEALGSLIDDLTKITGGPYKAEVFGIPLSLGGAIVLGLELGTPDPSDLPKIASIKSLTAPKLLAMTADDFLAMAAKTPDDALRFVKTLTPAQLSAWYTQLGKSFLKRDVIQTATRLILDDAAKSLPLSAKLVAAAPNPKTLAIITAGVLGIASWASLDNLIWVLTGGIIPLQQAKKYEEVITAVANARKTLHLLYDNIVWRGIANIFTAGIWEKVYSAEFERLDDIEASARTMISESEVGIIAIKTEPDSAVISVNGIQHRYKTPSIIEKLVPGNYTVLLELEGYKDHTEMVEVKAKEQAAIDHEFVPVDAEITPKAGRLEISAYSAKTSQPLLAAFYLNDRLEKATAHALTLDLKPGAYEIRLEAIGYEIWEDTVQVDENTTTKANAQMEKIGLAPEEPAPGEEPLAPKEPKVPEKGRLEVNCNVEAEILVGGQETAKTTPAGLDLTQGIYTITLRAEGYVQKSTTTLVKAGETTMVSLQLQAVEAPPIQTRLAKVSIQSEPIGAKILVNGVFTGKFTPDSVLLEAGDYEISLAKSGYYTWATPLRLVEET